MSSASRAPQGNVIRHAIDPVSRSTALLFGLIMVPTFTASLNAAEAGRIGASMIGLGLVLMAVAFALGGREP